MRDNKGVMAVAVGLIAGAVAAAYVTTGGSPPGINRRLHEQVGRSLAQESLKLLSPGGKLVVFARDTSEFSQEAADIARETFEREVVKAGSAITATKLIAVDPLRVVQVPPDAFFEILRRTGPGDVIASFMGPPLLTEEQQAALGEPKGKVVAFCSGAMPTYIDLALLADRKLLHTAVVSRPPHRTTTVKPGPESFDDTYEVVGAAALQNPARKGAAP